MKALVWGPTFEIANEKLNIFAVDSLRKRIVFNNGDIWKAINASESHRGQRANLSYIRRSLLTEDNPDYLPGMIRNCTYAYPWHGYCLYG